MGIRQAAAVRFSENGATAYELMATFGWVTMKCAEHFTERAEQQKLGLGGAHVFTAIDNEGRPLFQLTFCCLSIELQALPNFIGLCWVCSVAGDASGLNRTPFRA
jgi:hypothetical protein